MKTASWEAMCRPHPDQERIDAETVRLLRATAYQVSPRHRADKILSKKQVGLAEPLSPAKPQSAFRS